MRFDLSARSKDILFIFFIVFAVLLFRRYDAFNYPQLWAEDYTIYFLDFENYGFRSIIMPYGGYLHFLPRTFTGFFHYLHIGYFYIPRCYSCIELLFTFFITINIWKASEYLNVKNRIIYATAFLFLPLGSDIFMNLTNINWIASLYLFNFIFSWNTGYANKNYGLHLLVIFIISFSGPFSTLLSPLVVLLIILERKSLNIKNVIPLIIILIGGAAQLICMHGNIARDVQAPPESYHLIKMVTKNMSEIIFLHDHLTEWISPFKIFVISLMAFIMFIYVLIKCYLKVDNKRRYLLILYGLIMLASYIKSYWPKESLVLALENPRYYFLPFLCIAWIFLLAADKKISNLFVAVYLTFFLAHSHYIQMVLPDKQWKVQIQEYYDGKREDIQVNPEGWHAPGPKKK